MHSYDNNSKNYYGLSGHNNQTSSSITPSSSGSRMSRHGYTPGEQYDYNSNIGSSTQSSDTELEYGVVSRTRRRRESLVDLSYPNNSNLSNSNHRISSGSFSIVDEQNENHKNTLSSEEFANRLPVPDDTPPASFR